MSYPLTQQEHAEALTHAQALVRILAGDSPAPVPPSAWTVALKEEWRGPLIGGWTRVEHGPCTGGDDPGAEPRTQFGVQDWSAQGGKGGISSTNTGELIVDSHQSGSGFALLSGKLFDPNTHAINVDTTVDLRPDPGAWVGLALWNGDGNYREIGVAESNGSFVGQMNAPCYLLGLKPIAMPCRLQLAYSKLVGWEMWANGESIYFEPIGHKKNILLGKVNAGLWFVNLNAEASHGVDGLVRARVGPVTVQVMAL